jgi:hypothetical protein
VRDVCEIAGVPWIIEQARAELAGANVIDAVRRHDNASLFDWLMDVLAYQGISNAAAFTYMEQHGRITYDAIASSLGDKPICAKLASWWSFEGCGYRKAAATCNRPDLFRHCDLPKHDLRNGSLNQSAFGLYLFLRDATRGDLVGWIDERLDDAAEQLTGFQLGSHLLAPLRQIHGLSDKVLSMAFSMLLLAADPDRTRWINVGAHMIAIDTLVHKWFVRTGILRRLGGDHAYGRLCYAPGGCADIVMRCAGQIDATRFNAQFPVAFPRFIQHAIWRFCAQDGEARCNSVAIKDGTRCRQTECELHSACDRKVIVATTS